MPIWLLPRGMRCRCAVHVLCRIRLHVPTCVLCTVQVILADKFGKGSFFQLWQRLSHPYPTVQLQQAVPAGSPVCFKSALHAHYTSPGDALNDKGGQAGRRATCLSTIMLGMAHWQRSLFGGPTSINELRTWDTHSGGDLSLPSGGHRRLKMTFASREWFSRGMRAGAGLNSWQASRAMSSEQEATIIDGLQKAVRDWNARLCVKPVSGWWQNHTISAPQQGCKPSNISFELQVCAPYTPFL
jgi:hypothetical protein